MRWVSLRFYWAFCVRNLVIDCQNEVAKGSRWFDENIGYVYLGYIHRDNETCMNTVAIVLKVILFFP